MRENNGRQLWPHLGDLERFYGGRLSLLAALGYVESQKQGIGRGLQAEGVACERVLQQGEFGMQKA